MSTIGTADAQISESELVSAQVPECPLGYAPDESFGGLCARFEPASKVDDTCPEGALGEPGDCYVRVQILPPDPICLEGERVGWNCIIRGDLPVEDRATGLPTCADGFGIVNGECLRFVTATPATIVCPTWSEPGVDGGCRKPVITVSGGFFCEDPAAELNGALCVFTVPALAAQSPASIPGPAEPVPVEPVPVEPVPVEPVPVEPVPVEPVPVEPVPVEPVQAQPLAITGVERDLTAAVGLSLLGVGSTLLGLGRVRRRSSASDR